MLLLWPPAHRRRKAKHLSTLVREVIESVHAAGQADRQTIHILTQPTKPRTEGQSHSCREPPVGTMLVRLVSGSRSLEVEDDGSGIGAVACIVRVLSFDRGLRHGARLNLAYTPGLAVVHLEHLGPGQVAITARSFWELHHFQSPTQPCCRSPCPGSRCRLPPPMTRNVLPQIIIPLQAICLAVQLWLCPQAVR